MEFFIGMIGALVAVAIFYFGVYFGKRLKEAEIKRPETPAEEERRKFEEDQKAFTNLMGYSADVAYGLTLMGDEGRST